MIILSVTLPERLRSSCRVSHSFRVGTLLCSVAFAVFVLQAPTVQRALPIGKSSVGIIVLLALLVGYLAMGATIQFLSLAADPPTVQMRSVVFLSIASAAVLPALFVWILGESGSAYWYLVYLFFLPGGLLVAAHMSLFGASLRWKDLSLVPITLSVPALTASTASPLLSVSVFYEWLVPNTEVPGTAASLVALGLDLALLGWTHLRTR